MYGSRSYPLSATLSGYISIATAMIKAKSKSWTPKVKCQGLKIRNKNALLGALRRTSGEPCAFAARAKSNAFVSFYIKPCVPGGSSTMP
jgi:hypothetical protein